MTEAQPPVRRNTGAAGVIRAIKRDILGGAYDYNEKLPAERDLATRFGVARGTVRSALMELERIHLVRRKIGSGSYVIYDKHFKRRDIADQTSPVELIEARLAIEPSIVRLAISNATRRDLDTLEATLQQLTDAGDDGERFAIADESFHLALSRCCRNPLLIWIYERISSIRNHNRREAGADRALSADAIDGYNHQHRELVAAIRQRNQELAARIIGEHLERARSDLLGL